MVILLDVSIFVDYTKFTRCFEYHYVEFRQPNDTYILLYLERMDAY